MKSGLPIRCGLSLAGLLLVGATRSNAQAPSAKPSAAVSALPAAQTTGETAAAPVAPTSAEPAPQHVEVQYADGNLAVQATNASLNEILREVARKTGMKITGGVADDRVFGSYGPSKPSVVLDALLEGTGSNMLLVDDADGKSELTLTPRRGGATPPSPNADRNEAEDPAGAYVAPVRSYQPPVANGRGPGGGAGPDPSVIPASSSEQQGDLSGSKTPQQIYEQLQRSMQQKQNAPPQ